MNPAPVARVQRLRPSLGSARLILGAASVLCLASCSNGPELPEAEFVAMGELGGPLEVATVTTVSGILSVEPWTFGSSTGEIIRTTHYRIFTTEQNVAMRRRLASFLEHALTHYRTVLEPLPAPPVRLDTYLMDNRPQWERLTRQLMGSQASSLTSIQRGGFASRGIGVYYDLGLFDTCAIAAHEGWHQYTQRTFRDPLPIWLEEGIATFVEGHRWSRSTPVFQPWSNTERFDQLRRAASGGRLFTLDELLNSRPQDYVERADDSLLTYYAQLWAFVHFLNEGENQRYATGLRRVLRDAVAGRIRQNLTDQLGQRAAGVAMATRSGPGVFQVYFSDHQDAVAAEFDEFLRRLVVPGSRDRVVAGRSPLTSGDR